MCVFLFNRGWLVSATRLLTVKYISWCCRQRHLVLSRGSGNARAPRAGGEAPPPSTLDCLSHAFYVICLFCVMARVRTALVDCATGPTLYTTVTKAFITSPREQQISVRWRTYTYTVTLHGWYDFCLTYNFLAHFVNYWDCIGSTTAYTADTGLAHLLAYWRRICLFLSSCGCGLPPRSLANL